MAEALRLLILTRDRAGAPFRQRIEPYLEALAARGVTAEVVELAQCPWARRGQMRRGREFDGILLHRKTLTWWDAEALRGAARHLIYDFDDAVMYKARAPEQPHPGRLRRFERTMAQADLVIAGSPVLAARAEVAGARRIEVIPTGLQVRRYTPKADYAASAGAIRLAWIGSRSTLKQLAALRPALEAVGRALPQATLRVIADAELQVEGLRVENVPWSLEAEGRLLEESDVGIAPMADTPYTRGKCGFKILQYMAAGLPVVASPVGASAEYVKPEVNGFWATTPEEWVDALRRLSDSPTLRERLGRAGRERVAAEFDFAVLAPDVVDLVTRILAG